MSTTPEDLANLFQDSARRKKRDKRGKGKQQVAAAPVDKKDEEKQEDQPQPEPAAKKPKKEIIDLSEVKFEDPKDAGRRARRQQKEDVDTRPNLLIIAVAPYQEKDPQRRRIRRPTITSIDESDVRSIFQEFSLLAVEDHQLYFIVQFKSSEDCENAKKKHKMLYKNSLHILMDGYDGSQENPKCLREESTWNSTGSRPGPGTSQYYDNSEQDQRHQYHQPARNMFQMGAALAEHQSSNRPRPEGQSNAYNSQSRRPPRGENQPRTPLFQMGGALQQQQQAPVPRIVSGDAVPKPNASTATPAIPKGTNRFNMLHDEEEDE